jgi:two-component system, CAI-1 autoinducer sensor kinase/phosphatase CqsS
MKKLGGKTGNTWFAWRHWLGWLREELMHAPMEPILHASPRRLWWLGMSIFFGNALFALIWSRWLPQPYENLGLRVLASLLGYVLMMRRINQDPTSILAQRMFTLVFWLELPVFFTWMYLCNSANSVWLATMAVMVLIYYLVTDWRLATLGTVTGGLLAWMIFQVAGPAVPPVAQDQWPVHAVVFTFAWLSALILNLSSANLRRAQLASTLTTMGIMAHELRTPLSTASLLGDAIRLESERPADPAHPAQLERLATRLHALVRNMNHQIDTQIANAKLLQLPRYSEAVHAADLVHDVVRAYPYSTTRQRDCVRLIVHDDFVFRSSRTQFSQVLDNLIKNALHSLMAADSRFAPGSLRIEVGVLDGLGRIAVTDEGMGIEANLIAHIFKPFFSSNRSTGHGLGLAFCQRVVHSAGGRISVKSEYAIGATFVIELPHAKQLADDSAEQFG